MDSTRYTDGGSNDSVVSESEGAYRYRAPAEQSVSEAVVEAVAAATGRRAVATLPSAGGGTEADPSADAGGVADVLEPLYDAVDPDALDALFRSRGDDAGVPAGTVTFTYSGRRVTVESGGVVTVSAV